jgi:hypothetical protein
VFIVRILKPAGQVSQSAVTPGEPPCRWQKALLQLTLSLLIMASTFLFQQINVD